MGNVLIGGVFYGLHNIGDEAILESILSCFIENNRMSVMTFGSEWIDEKYPGVEKLPIIAYDKPKFGLIATPRKRILTSIKNSFFPDTAAFKDKDLFICGGATILSDCPWHSLRLVQQAEKSGVPAILWAVGMADVKDEETLRYIRNVCDSGAVSHIYTRDEFTYKRLIGYGVDAEKVSVCYDAAYVLEGNPEGALSLLTEGEKQLYWDKRPNICISISGESDVKDAGHIHAVKEYIEKITEGMNVFLVPTGLGAHCRDREILKSLKVNQNVVYIDREFQPQQIIAFLQNMELIISSRLHCSIFGANVGTPSINLIRNTKQEDFAKLFNLPALKMDTLTADILMNLTEEMMANRADISAGMKEKIKGIRAVHMNACEEVQRKYLGKA